MLKSALVNPILTVMYTVAGVFLGLLGQPLVNCGDVCNVYNL